MSEAPPDTAAVDPLAEIEALTAFEARGPGTDAERRAADHLVRRLRALGRQADVEPFRTWPGYAPAHFLHAVLAAAASVVSVFLPLVGLAVALAVLASTLLDLSGRAFLARRLTPGRASQNVVSPEHGGRPGTLVLVAHYDAARTGGVFRLGLLPRLAALARATRLPLGPTQLLAALFTLTAAAAAVRVAVPESYALNLVQLVCVALLLVAGAALAGVTVSPIVPGANDNASGVAVALRLAERHGGALEHFDLWVLLTGADEGLLLGASSFVRTHRRGLDRRRTVFVGLDGVGAGSVRYARREGTLRRRRYYGPLVALCDELAAEEAAGEERSVSRAEASPAHAAARRGYPAVALSCAGPSGSTPHRHLPTDTPDRIEPAALDQATEFASGLLERIDERLGPAVAALDLEADRDEEPTAAP